MTVLSAAVISGVLVFNFVVFPGGIMESTQQARDVRSAASASAEAEKKQQELAQKLEEENKALKFVDQKVVIKIKDYGDLNIDLKDKAAPKTVENFVRLSYRDYYKGTTFHRMVISDNSNVIQGGDPLATGLGGETALQVPRVDELWKTKPEYETVSAPAQTDPSLPPTPTRGALKNNPEFADPELYSNFDKEIGIVEYRKGLILMAKTSAPDSATSQFFVTLDKTILPAEYTVFGVIQESSMDVLDKIKAEVEPEANPQIPEGSGYQDGKPNKELKVENIEILK